MTGRLVAGGALLVVAGLLVGCSGASRKSVQFDATGGTPGHVYLSTGQASGLFPAGTPAARGHISLPWISPISRLKPGTHVAFTISTPQHDPHIVMCKITSNGRVVAKDSASDGAVATCSGNV